MRAAADRLPPSCKEPGRSCLHPRAHASNLFIPTTRLWAALKSRLLLGQAGFGSRNLPEISPKHRITDLYAWTLGSDRLPTTSENPEHGTRADAQRFRDRRLRQ